MLIKKVELENFLSFSQLSFDVGATGVLLVSGRNGAGKSSLTSKAITWGLFGETPGGVKGDDVASVQSPKDPTRVKIWLDLHGRPWIIERTRNPGRLVVVDTEAGKDVSFRNMRDTQEYIHQLLGRDIDGFLSADYFGQDRKKRFLEVGPSVQQSIVEGILKIDQRVDPLVEAAKARVDQLTSEREQLALDSRGAEAKGEELQRQQIQLMPRISATKQELQELQDKEIFPPVMPPVPEPPEEVPVPANPPPPSVTLLPLPEVPDLEVEERQAEQQRQTRMAESMDFVITTFREEKEQAAVQLRNLEEEVRVLQETIRFEQSKVREVTEKICPECKQPVDAEVTNRLLAQQKEIQQHISEFQTKVSAAQEKMPPLRDQISGAESKLEQAARQRQVHQAQVAEITSEINSYFSAKQRYNEVLQQNQTAADRATEAFEAEKARIHEEYERAKERQRSAYESAKQNYQQQVDAINKQYQADVNHRAQQIAAKEATITELNRSLKEIQEEMVRQSQRKEGLERQKSDLLQLLQVSRDWVKIFRQSFKRFMLEQCLPFLNERTAHHLALLNNSQIEVEFITLKELKSGEERNCFQAVARTRMGGQAYSHLSGGERQMASFAVGLTLAELADIQSGASSEFMILDEPFTELDPTNCASVIHHINNELLKSKQSVLLISNDPHLRQLVANRVEVVKNDQGVSSLEIG